MGKQVNSLIKIDFLSFPISIWKYQYTCHMRLSVSKKSDVALQALRILSKDRGVHSGQSLADVLDVSLVYLSQSLSPLVKGGWLTSRVGPDGGYALVPRLKKLSVMQVVEAIEGPIEGSSCVVSSRTCGVDSPCMMHVTWSGARASLRRSLASISAI